MEEQFNFLPEVEAKAADAFGPERQRSGDVLSGAQDMSLALLAEGRPAGQRAAVRPGCERLRLHRIRPHRTSCLRRGCQVRRVAPAWLIRLGAVTVRTGAESRRQ